MSKARHVLDSLTRSTYARQTADLVLLGKEDSSGVTVASRRADLADQHRHAPFRLVPVATLAEAVEQWDALEAEARQWQQMAADFADAVRRCDWPAAIRLAGGATDEDASAPAPAVKCPCCGEAGYDSPADCTFCADQDHEHAAGTEGQDRESYTDDQDRDAYTVADMETDGDDS